MPFSKKHPPVQPIRDLVKSLAHTAEQPLVPGTSFGVYELQRQIASGGTAAIFEALRAPDNKKVALKILHAHLAADPTFLARFEQEAKIAASLSHPNIVSVYEYGVVDGRHFIVMEYIDGFSLDDAIVKLKTVPCAAAAAIAAKACGALGFAHACNILHRDVKPGNIIVGRTGEVKVTDFGFSRVLDNPNTRLTVHNRVVGTPMYMSPEQIEGGSVTFSTDVFSLGTVLYFLVTGVPPFAGSGALAIMKKIIDGDYAQPRKINRKVPRKFQEIIVQCLERDRSLRYESMAELKSALDGFLMDARVESTEKGIGALVNLFNNAS
ncbi:MAG TPA: serine/threonine-protein kinase [Chitinivibrionales bacterium]|nr:serine/threonine-protein kinase [Chitinivibrionales bacterium]